MEASPLCGKSLSAPLRACVIPYLEITQYLQPNVRRPLASVRNSLYLCALSRAGARPRSPKDTYIPII